MLKFKLFYRSDVVVRLIFRPKKCALFSVIINGNRYDKIDLFDITKDKLFNSFNYKFIVYKSLSGIRFIEFITYYVARQISRVKIDIRKLLSQLMFLLMYEYKVMGVKCIVSGRIKGSQRAKKEIFRVGNNSLAKMTTIVKYYSSYLTTKYGKLGVKLWLFM